MKQQNFFPSQKLFHGGKLRRQRKFRQARPISDRDSMHLILKSSYANGPWSFRAANNKQKVISLIEKFGAKHAVKLLSIANAGNHIHLHIKLTTRHTYRAFIRGLTAALAMAITGASRWNKLKIKFWDYRPYTRILKGWKAMLTLRDYIHVNQLESAGATRDEAKVLVAWRVSRGKYSAWAETG